MSPSNLYNAVYVLYGAKDVRHVRERDQLSSVGNGRVNVRRIDYAFVIRFNHIEYYPVLTESDPREVVGMVFNR